jgi:arginine repressor
MAKKTVTKADRIRDYVTSNPGARPKDVIAALAKKNIKVTSAQVSTLVRKMQTPKVSKAAKTTTNAYRAAATGEKLISSLDQALAIIATYNAFVAACGGKDQADKAFVALTQEGLTA